MITSATALTIINKLLDNQRLNKVQELILQQSWEEKSYLEIAEQFDYDPGYIKDAGSKLWQLLSKGLGEKVTKNNFKSVLWQYYHQLGTATSPQIQSLATDSMMVADNRYHSHQDWGDAIDVSAFYGRTEELATLERWIVGDRCRLVTILGMGGIGKTTLAAKLAHQIQDEFEYLIWRSLRNAPLIQDLLVDVLHILSPELEATLPETVASAIAKLMQYLRQHRCLLILDNVESVLQECDRTGCYREGYEGYGQLLRYVAEIPHQSTVLITSREKPIGLAAKEGKTLPVRSLQLAGLLALEVQEIFQAIGSFQGSESDWNFLTSYYGGNPLALKSIAPTIQELFTSNIANFIKVFQNSLVCDTIRNLLDPQFNRLSDLEKELMYWLAIHREPVSLRQLPKDLKTRLPDEELLEGLGSLVRRSLLEKQSDCYTQHPFVLEYVTERYQRVRRKATCPYNSNIQLLEYACLENHCDYFSSNL